jgi:hypothetical protein
MSGEPGGDPRRTGEQARPDSERPNRFLGMVLWQQIVSGIIAGVVVAVIAAYFITSPSNPSDGRNLGTGSSSTPINGATAATTSQRRAGNSWLDQLTPASGEASSSTLVPDNTADGASEPLSHELLIPSAQNGNTVTYNLNSEYKTLNIQVAVAPGDSSLSGTNLGITLNGAVYQLDPPSDTADFFPVITSPENWILAVSGVKTLQLQVQDESTGMGPSLLVSGYLSS